MALYVRESIPVQRIKVNVPKELECIWLTLRPHCLPRQVSSLTIAVVYNPPKAPTEHLLMDHLAHSAMSLKGKYTNCGLIICGDFNQAKITTLQDRQLLNVVKFPTRDKNTLDLIITNISGLYETPQRLPPVGKSDHVSILWSPSRLGDDTSRHHSC